MGKSCFNYKFLLNCFNFFFLLCGTVLISSGFYLFTDTKRILLSRLLAATSDQLSSLPQPLFYYMSIGIAVAGLIAVLAAILGFWASCLNTYCLLSIYFLTVVILLLTETIACLAITLWPHCLGISLDATKMVKALQSNYGVPNKEQFTIAMDLAQARFGCCGMNSDSNFDISLWKLQGYGQREWAVPLTCCILENVNEKLSYLDPKPVNETKCQSVEKSEHQHFRYMNSCISYLDNWYREQYAVFLVASLVMAIIEFGVLLSIVLSCTRISSKTVFIDDGSIRKEGKRERTKSCQVLVENIYEPEVELRTTDIHSNNVNNFLSETFKEVYVQPRELYKQRHNTTFKPSLSNYGTAMGRSHLV